MPTKKELEGQAAAKDYIDNLSEKELSALKDSFRDAFNSLIKKEQDKLLSIQSTIEKLKKQSKDLWDRQRLATYPESGQIMDERTAVRISIKELENEVLQQHNVVQCLENGGELSNITDLKGKEHESIPDFRKVDTNQILFDIDTILTDKRPVYIPLINEEAFKYRGFVSDAIRLSRDSYILAIVRHDEEKETDYVLVTLDQLVLITDYYYTIAEANAIKEAEEINKRREESYDRQSDKNKIRYLDQSNQEYVYKSLPAVKKKTISLEEWKKLTWQEKDKIHKFIQKKRPKKLKSVLQENYMWASFHSMYERFIDPEAVHPKPRTANPKAFAYWMVFREMMDYKIKDIKIQRIDLSESYKAAIETSFGESNTSDVLKEKYGILVKRQNGSVINPVEIQQIENAFISVQKIFGNLKPNCLKSNMKISHTGTRYVFASKAIGMFVSNMGTIAVSDKYGDNEFKMTMAHEVAHYIDSFVGELNEKRWATDDYEGVAGRIAFTFRDNMNKPKSQQTEYTNATKECFARALQQYYGIETFGNEAGVVFSDKPLDKFRPFFVADDFVSETAYEQKIKPLIQEFLKENKDVFKYTVDIDESNEPEPIGSEVEAQYEAAISSLETLLEVSGGKDEKEIKEAIEAVKLLQGLGVDKMADGGDTDNVNNFKLLDFRLSKKIRQASETFKKHWSKNAYFVIMSTIQAECKTIEEAENMAVMLAKKTIFISPTYEIDNKNKMSTSKLHLIFDGEKMADGGELEEPIDVVIEGRLEDGVETVLLVYPTNAPLIEFHSWFDVGKKSWYDREKEEWRHTISATFNEMSNKSEDELIKIHFLLDTKKEDGSFYRSNPSSRVRAEFKKRLEKILNSKSKMADGGEVVWRRFYSKTDKGESFTDNGIEYVFENHKPRERRTKGGWHPEKWVYKYKDEISKPTPIISIDNIAKKVADKVGGFISFKSKSGSVYIEIPSINKKVRISNHFVLDRDVMNPKSREDFNFVQREFSESDVDDIVDEIKNELNDNKMADGGEISKLIDNKLKDLGFKFNKGNYRYGKTINDNTYISPYYDKSKDLYKISGVYKFKTPLGGNSVGINLEFKDEDEFWNKINEYLSKENTLNNKMADGGEILDSESFRKWFGNSKVVDENGKPLIVYHGTTKDFYSFNSLKDSLVERGVVKDDDKYPHLTPQFTQFGNFFSSSPQTAEFYANTHIKTKEFVDHEKELDSIEKRLSLGNKEHSDEELKSIANEWLVVNSKWQKKVKDKEVDEWYGGTIYPVYLKLENPLIVDAKGKYWFKILSQVFQKVSKDNDGIIFKNIIEAGGEVQTTYVVFNPSHVKSAIANKGTFDLGNPDITMADGGEVPSSKEEIEEKLNSIPLLIHFKESTISFYIDNEMKLAKKTLDMYKSFKDQTNPNSKNFTKKRVDEMVENQEKYIRELPIKATKEANKIWDKKLGKLIGKLYSYGFNTSNMKVEDIGHKGLEDVEFLISNDSTVVHARIIIAEGEQNAKHYRFITTKRDKSKMADGGSLPNKKNIKILPRKVKYKSYRNRMFGTDKVAWVCDLELTLLNGKKRVVNARQFMEKTKLKADAIKIAKKYRDYMLTKGDFYFI